MANLFWHSLGVNSGGLGCVCDILPARLRLPLGKGSSFRFGSGVELRATFNAMVCPVFPFFFR